MKMKNIAKYVLPLAFLTTDALATHTETPLYRKSDNMEQIYIGRQWRKVQSCGIYFRTQRPECLLDERVHILIRDNYGSRWINTNLPRDTPQ